MQEVEKSGCLPVGRLLSSKRGRLEGYCSFLYMFQSKNNRSGNGRGISLQEGEKRDNSLMIAAKYLVPGNEPRCLVSSRDVLCSLRDEVFTSDKRVTQGTQACRKLHLHGPPRALSLAVLSHSFARQACFPTVNAGDSFDPSKLSDRLQIWRGYVSNDSLTMYREVYHYVEANL